jgi:hypothetical protein
MPTYQIKAPDGNTYRIDGPEGASDDQVREQVLKQHPNAGGASQAAIPSPAAPQSSGIGDFVKSIPRGAVEGFMGAASALGRATAGEMGQEPAQIPSGQESTRQIEQNVTGEMHKPEGRAGRFGAAVGETLGNPVSYVGPGSAALKVGAGMVSALGSEAAGQGAEALHLGPKAETAARIAGGVVSGGAAASVAAERNLSQLAAKLPTPEKIYEGAKAGYEMLKKSNTRISPEGTEALMNDIKSELHADNFRDYLAPSTYRAIEELGVNGAATIGDLDGVRKLLNRVSANGVGGKTDQDAARRAIKAIDDFISNVPDHYVLSGNPTADAAILKHSQKMWAIHKQLDTVEEESIVGQHRAGVSGTGANRINTARQEIRKILDSDKKSRGMSDAVKDKMEEIVMGTWATNSARYASKYAPSGPVSALFGVVAGMGAGTGVGAGVAGAGFLAKHLGEYLTQRQIRELEDLIKSESPIGKGVAQEIAPQQAEQRMVPAAQAARAALTSPLASGGP